MLIRLLQGHVLEGREAAFLARIREVVADTGAGMPGLASLVLSYRRDAGIERFLVASGWDTFGDIVAGAETDGSHGPRLAELLAGLAEVDLVEHFEAIEVGPRGFVDIPGGVLRLTRGLAIAGREEAALRYLRDATASIRPVSLAILVGRRLVGRRMEYVMASAWPDRLALEALTGPVPDDRPTDRDRPDLFDQVERSHWQLVELRLPADLAPAAAPRMLVARFEAEAAATVLADLETRLGAGATRIADLGSTEYGRGPRPDLRVVTVHYPVERQAEVERAVSDHGGEILTARGPGAR